MSYRCSCDWMISWSTPSAATYPADFTTPTACVVQCPPGYAMNSTAWPMFFSISALLSTISFVSRGMPIWSKCRCLKPCVPIVIPASAISRSSLHGMIVGWPIHPTGTKNVAVKPYFFRRGNAYSCWSRQPSSKVRATDFGGIGVPWSKYSVRASSGTLR